VNQIRIYSGQKYETVNEIEAGFVCAVTGLSLTRPGQGLGIEKASAAPILEPVLSYQIILPDGCDPRWILPRLRQLEEEVPELHIVWNEELQEIQAQIMGEVQIEILKSLIQKRFGISVSFGSGQVVYKETIANTVEGVGHFEPLRHYAEVHLLMEPGEPGSGLVFDTKCSEDMLGKTGRD
jgi:ribosomal protection tetracycline resistance protein